MVAGIVRLDVAGTLIKVEEVEVFNTEVGVMMVFVI